MIPPQTACVRPFSLREKGGFWAVLLHTGVPLTKRLPFPQGELSAKLTEGWPLRRSWSIPPSRLRRATVPQFNMVASLRAQSALAMFPVSLGSSYRPALRWPGIPGLRSASRCSSIQHGRTTALASSLAALPASLGLLRPVSRTARGLRAPLAPSPLRGFDGYGLFPPQAAAFVRPF